MATRMKLLGLARSCHPEPTLAVTALLTLLALRWGRGPGTAWVTSAVLSGQLSVGWANDYLDRYRDAGRLDKPLAVGTLPASWVRNASIIALVLAVGLSMASGLAAALAHIAALSLAHAYNLRLKSTDASVVAYSLAFALAPAFVTLGLPAHRLPPAWIVLAAALIGGGAHFTQTLGDHDRDRESGIRGLPQRIGRPASVIAAGAILALAAMVATVGPGRPSAIALGLLLVSLLLVAGLVVAGLSRRYRASFRLNVLAAGCTVLIFVAGSSTGGL
ncbi:MAG: UbiA family prenyltransferase [Candidatus Dormibacteria bacterium]